MQNVEPPSDKVQARNAAISERVERHKKTERKKKAGNIVSTRKETREARFGREVTNDVGHALITSPIDELSTLASVRSAGRGEITTVTFVRTFRFLVVER